jgi:hypothetical protein
MVFDKVARTGCEEACGGVNEETRNASRTVHRGVELY